MAAAFKSEKREEMQRGGICGINAGDHDVFADRFGAENKRPQKQRTNATPTLSCPNVNRAFDGETIAGQGSKIAEAREPSDVIALVGHKNGIALIEARFPPRESIYDRCRLVVLDGGRVREDFVIDRGDRVDVRLDSISDFHAPTPTSDSLLSE
jgi:hypothetical protein